MHQTIIEAEPSDADARPDPVRNLRRTRAPTIQDVARAGGVSVSTVSRVARDHADVKEATRQHVLATIERLGYRPSPLARALVSGRTQTLGLLVSDISNPFYPQLAKSIEREAKRHGNAVVICNTEDDVHETRGYLERLVDQGIDALIHASVGQDEQVVHDLLQERTQVVYVNRRPLDPGANYVVSDNVAGARLLTRHLLDRGHRRIGFIGGPDFASNARERMEGFQATMRTCSEAKALISIGDFSKESGSAGAMELLALDLRPTAIIAVNDGVAVGVVDTLLGLGLTVPGDIAVAGFDDISLASTSIMPLTTVAQHIEEMGTLAVQRLLQLSGDADPTDGPLQTVLEPELLVRASTDRILAKVDGAS